jgi:hypothetical protein
MPFVVENLDKQRQPNGVVLPRDSKTRIRKREKLANIAVSRENKQKERDVKVIMKREMEKLRQCLDRLPPPDGWKVRSRLGV